MGNNSEANNQVLGEGFAIEANETEDVYIFVSTRTGEVFGVKVSIQVCSEVALEDQRCDMLIDLEEAITQTVVGNYRLTKKFHQKEYLGSLRLTSAGLVEFP